VLSARLDGLDAEGLRAVMDTLRERMGPGVIFLGSSMDGKVTLVASVSADLTKRVQAGKLMQAVAPLVGGKGGGRPDLAQGGGTDASRLDDALAGVAGLIEQARKI
jgi:alanyl-tRNA synthetase